MVGIELSLLWHQQHQASNHQTLLQNSIGTHPEEMVAGANAVEQPQRLAGDHALDLGTVLRRRAGASERGDLLLMAGLDSIFSAHQQPTTTRRVAANSLASSCRPSEGSVVSKGSAHVLLRASEWRKFTKTAPPHGQPAVLLAYHWPAVQAGRRSGPAGLTAQRGATRGAACPSWSPPSGARQGR